MNSGRVPEGWTHASLGDVATLRKESVDPADYPDAAYLSLEHVESGSNRVAGCGRGGDVKSAKWAFFAGDILYGKLRPYLNKVAIPEYDGICSTDFLVFRKTPRIENRYLMWFLSQPEVVEYAHHHSTGVELPRVRFANLAELRIGLPPLVEQKRIVAAVEGVLGRVKAVRERLESVRFVMRRFRRAVLAAACNGRLTAEWRGGNADGEVPQGWQSRGLGELASRITSGSRDWKRYYRDDGPGTFVMAANVRPMRLDFSEKVSVDPPANSPDRERSQVSRGDLLVTIVGANTGDVCLVRSELDQCYVCQSVALIRPSDTQNAEFLELYLNSPEHGQAQFEDWIYGAGRPHLSFDQLRTTRIALPPYSEQVEIVRRIDVLFGLADTIEGRVEAAAKRAQRLAQAVLAKAFRGELVPTEAELARREGREYEPASELLARLA